MTTKQRIRRVVASVVLVGAIGVPAEMAAMNVLATPAHALSCQKLAANSITKRNGAYWARRWFRAGCGN